MTVRRSSFCVKCYDSLFLISSPEINKSVDSFQEGDYLLWNIERTITKIYIPVLLDSCMGDKGTKDLLTKVGSPPQIPYTRAYGTRTLGYVRAAIRVSD